MTYVYDLLAVFNGLALLLVAVLLVRGQHRQFWAVLSYVVWELFATATLTIFNVVNSGPAQGVSRGAQADAVRWYARLYWSNDVIVDLFRFSLVIVLMYRATPEGAKRLSAGRVLGGVAAVAVVLPFLLFPMGPSSTPPWPRAGWFNSTSELLNFGAAMMNLALWGALIANRKRDPQLTAVSVGLGIVVTGAAASYGLRYLLPSQAIFIPNLFLMVTQLAGWAVWCRAFWPATRQIVVPDKALAWPQ